MTSNQQQFWDQCFREEAARLARSCGSLEIATKAAEFADAAASHREHNAIVRHEELENLRREVEVHRENEDSLSAELNRMFYLLGAANREVFRLENDLPALRKQAERDRAYIKNLEGIRARAEASEPLVRPRLWQRALAKVMGLFLKPERVDPMDSDERRRVKHLTGWALKGRYNL